MRTSNRFAAFIASVAVSAVATFALLSFLDSDEAVNGAPSGRPTSLDNGGLTSPSPTPVEVEPRFAIIDAENRAGGYAFRYPPGWELTTNQTVSTLTAPNGNTVVTFGLGATGTLEEAAAAFVELLRETYDGISMQAVRPTTVNALPARVVRGSALNADEVKVVFQAFTVRSEGQNFAISVFSRRTTGAAVDEIVQSFGVTAPT